MKRSAYLGGIIWIIFLTKLNTPGITSLFLCMCVGYIFSHIKQSGHFSCGTKCFLIHLFRNPMNETHWSQGVVCTVYHSAGEIILESHTILLSFPSQKDTARTTAQAQLASFHVPLGLCKYSRWAEHW